jgi:hemerythrin superfamily protein
LTEHEDIDQLFHEYISTKENEHGKKQAAVDKIIEKITRHTHLEEETIYRSLEGKGDEHVSDLVLEAIEEHKLAEYLMDQLKRTKADDKTFDAKFMVLMETTRYHFLEEERGLFPAAMKLIPDELESLGKDMTVLEEQMEA